MKTEYLLTDELDHVLAALTEPNRLVCRVCLDTGLRVGDVLKLRTEQLKNDSGQFWITESKTGKKRRVNLKKALLTDLRAQAGSLWVFEGRNSSTKHRTRQAVWADVKRASRAFRLPQNIGVHSLRKYYAVQKMENSGDLAYVQRLLNHDDQATTMIYAMAYELYCQKYKTSYKVRKRRKN